MTNAFSLSRADIASATGWGYRAVRRLIETPYRLQSKRDAAGMQGGATVERFRLSDVLPRIRQHSAIPDTATEHLIAADAEHRKGTKQ